MELLTMKAPQLQQQILQSIPVHLQQQKRNTAAQEKPQMGMKSTETSCFEDKGQCPVSPRDMHQREARKVVIKH